MKGSDKIEIRRIQALTGDRSLTLVFPNQFPTYQEKFLNFPILPL